MDTKEAPEIIIEADKKNGVNIIKGIDSGLLLSFCERIEFIEEQKKALNEDIKYIYEEAAHRGFDKKALRELLKRRKMDENDVRELDFCVETYKKALGME